MSINKVILAGNVGKDPVVKYFDKGVVKTTFPLATSETHNNQQGETVTQTEWHNIVLWGRELAEIAEKTIKKGALVYVVGKIKTRSYVDKEGVNKYITEILADTLLPLEKKQTVAAPVQSTKTEVQTNNTMVHEGAQTYSAAQNNDFSTDASVNGNLQPEDDLPF